MDKTTAGLLTGVAALALAPAHATPVPATPAAYSAALSAASYADLLSPIPNAQSLLAAAPRLQPTQIAALEGQPADHHHHHHHAQTHHHHHHHDQMVVPVPPPPPAPHHHHHHHHHNWQQP